MLWVNAYSKDAPVSDYFFDTEDEANKHAILKYRIGPAIRVTYDVEIKEGE